MNEITDNRLQQAAECFMHARGNLMEGAAYLIEIKDKKLWQGAYSSFKEYLEQACQISPGMASKLIKVYQHYVLEGGFSQRNLQGVDNEKLYMLVEAPMTVETKFTKAQNLSRAELRQELAEHNHPTCTHPQTYSVLICEDCQKRL
jgi:hypothetical protein